MRKSTSCVYCAKPLDEGTRTIDHVIARSWYPCDTPRNVEKWRVSACNSCNNSFSRLEERLLVLLAWSLNPRDTATRGIIDDVKRSIDPSAARSHSDRQKRNEKRRWLMEQIFPFDLAMANAVLPSTRGNYDRGSRTAVRIPADDFNSVIKKWTRGMHFIYQAEILPPEISIDVHHVDDAHAMMAFSEISKHAKILQRGAGIEVRQFMASNGDRCAAIYAFSIWGQMRVYSSFDSPVI